jgi:isocitrate dehydrogenase kinase/phosphatase
VPPGGLRDAFLAEHADLLDIHFWQGVQKRLAAGEIVDVFPYPRNARLQRNEGRGAG